MTFTDFLGTGFNFPLKIENGRVARAQGELSIRQSIILILATAKGERVMRPDFGCGINGLIFELNTAKTATQTSYLVREALEAYEPRIDILNVDAQPDGKNRNKLNVMIEYRIRSTNAKQNMVYPFFLEAR
ncbi:GPW/gp25 family protein [Desulfobacter vibrioformis]|uniref:GPW/gp25 family protein n=1 Tax=Desulfobacter vibrioformis TaxID=34031 RepID=UPI0005583AE1|nr:GPW/gp25 family protein [Desulfobacter vibrioformis]